MLVREINRNLEEPNEEKFLQELFEQQWPSLKLTLFKSLIETAPTLDNKETEALKPVYRLTSEAEELLRAAAADPHGRVIMMRTMHGLFVQTNSKEFAEQMNPRSEAMWQGVVRELLQKGLLSNVGSKGEVFKVTTDGYRAADDLKHSRGIDNTENGKKVPA